jgi:hypothetical protein
MPRDVISDPTQRNTLIVLTLVPAVLAFSLLLAHVLEIAGKLQLDARSWLMVQQHLYIAFAPTGAICEIAAIILSWAVFVRNRHTPGRISALIAALCFSAALALWFILVAPMNDRINAWTPARLPTNWQAARNRWEIGHGLALLLYAAGIMPLARLLFVSADGVARRARPP